MEGSLRAKTVDSNGSPLSMRSMTGYPRLAVILSSTRTTRWAGRFRSISIDNASRLKSSTTLNVRKRRPLIRESCMKSTDQLWFIASGVVNGAGLRTGICGENSASADSKFGGSFYDSMDIPAAEGAEITLGNHIVDTFRQQPVMQK